MKAMVIGIRQSACRFRGVAEETRTGGDGIGTRYCTFRFRGVVRQEMPETPQVPEMSCAAGSVTVRCVTVTEFGGASGRACVGYTKSESPSNQPLVPTAHPLSRVGTRAGGAAAAQRQRWAAA